jgi:hypothetical protein
LYFDIQSQQLIPNQLLDKMKYSKNRDVLYKHWISLSKKIYIYLLMKYDRLNILVNVQVVRRYLMRVSLDVFELIIPRDRIFVVL